MATVTFWTNASTKGLYLSELKRAGIEPESVSARPSKVSEQRVVMSLVFPGERLEPKVYAVLKRFEGNRVIHDMKVR